MSFIQSKVFAVSTKVQFLWKELMVSPSQELTGDALSCFIAVFQVHQKLLIFCFFNTVMQFGGLFLVAQGFG
jgi:hypothetical protein